MNKDTRAIVESLKASMKSVRDLPIALAGLYQFALSDDQKELAKNALRGFVLTLLVGGNKARQDKQQVQRIEDAYRARN